MANSAGEMPFLDHLEELRKRILLSLAAIVAGFCVGWWLTTRFELIKIVERPIVPFVQGGKLLVLTATGSFMIVMKFAFILGLVLASPFVVYQVWLFLSPALTQREKRAILPSLGVGFLLFAGGAALGWFLVIPPAIEWLQNFQAGSFNMQPTYDSYMQLVVHLLVGMGISAELPLVMILLASLGVLSYRMYVKVRRYAVLAAFIGGAILAPTPEVTMMILFTIPLLLLYEVGVAGAWLVERRKARAARMAAGVLLFVLCFSPRGLHAQIPPPAVRQRPPSIVDTTRRGVTGQGLQTRDTSTLKRLGLPTGPSHNFGSPDPIMQALLAREGFASTRFGGDSVRYNINDEQILLGGHAATLRSDGQLEADQIIYDNPRCEVLATGEPRMFNKGQAPMIALNMRVRICEGAERGVMQEAFTSMAQGGANWFMRGNLAVDSSGKRLYGAHTEFTSCDLPDPHYHFVASEMKWVSQSIIVARPAVLYIRDVPVAWLPFIFQDTKRDRSSGILIPRFGFNDIVRTNRNYNRTVSNIGYYWAPNDYIDLTASLDWYANRYTMITGSLNYKWLDRFVTGSLRLSRQMESGGSASNVLHWDHRQSFDVTTSLTFNVNYQSDSRVQLNNAIDPLASTAQISSQLNLSKRFSFGSVSLGGSRSEALGTGVGTMTLPQLSFQPKAVQLGPHVLWSPSLTVNNTTGFNKPQAALPVLTLIGQDTLMSTGHDRSTRIDVGTPFQFGGFSWQNQLSYTDQQVVGRVVTTERVPNPDTGGADSVTRTTIRAGNFSTGVNWQTSINLPLLAHGTWNLTPSIGVTNVTSGDFLIKTPGSRGAWVAQGKKVQVGLDAAPTFFAFTNGGIGPFTKLRYTLAPSISGRWSPASSVSPEFARATGSVGGQSLTEIPATSTAQMSLHQTLEGKFKPAADDTNSDPTHLPKKRLISLQTSPIEYDFEQAKLVHRTGWKTSSLTNSFQSDLIPGLTLSTTHSLWQGQVGTDSATFSPFLSQANASLQLTGSFFRSIGQLFGLVHKDSVTRPPTPASSGVPPPIVATPSFSSVRSGNAPMAARGFSVGLNYSLQRYRANGTTALPVSTEPGGFGMNDPLGIGSIIPVVTQPAQSQLGVNMAFAPTAFWSVTWNTQYDISHGTFLQQNVVLQRDLHDWRASFTFTKNTNGNFALYFTVVLVNLPDIKFDYNQTTLQQAPVRP